METKFVSTRFATALSELVVMMSELVNEYPGWIVKSWKVIVDNSLSGCVQYCAVIELRNATSAKLRKHSIV